MTPSRIRVSSPAKLNLYLEIKGRRPDGYHELRLLNAGIDWRDEVEVELSGEGIGFECSTPGVPAGDDNLCVKAARIFLETARSQDGGAWTSPASSIAGVRIRLTKRLPVASGLGGGSGNAAAVLWALRELLGSRTSDDELRGLGLRVGADVPFFLFESPAWVEGIGEKLRPAPALPDWHYLLVSFPFGVSTAWAFAQWDLTSSRTWDNFLEVPHQAEGDGIPVPGTWRNDLEEVVSAKHPEVRRAKEALLRAGAIGAMMSGSGPSVYGFFHQEATLKTISDLSGLSPGTRVQTGRLLQGRLLEEI
jgi:4-diphosphocytidyl-2-C-methyl-D-erythritol kinase